MAEIPSQNSEKMENFEQSCEAVLKYLHAYTGFRLWMVTRVEGNDWIVLAAEDHGYGVKSGQVMDWQESFCSRMVRGEGPQIAPNCAEVPAYANAPVARQREIGTYVGLPLSRRNGALFGTLCGIDPKTSDPSLEQEKALLNVFSDLLSRIINLELDSQEYQRKIELAMEESARDELTGLLNRRGWEQVTSAEEARCVRLASPATVIVADLDGLKRMNDTHGHAAGDALIKKVADLLKVACRSGDRVARIGGDEFAILAPSTREDEAVRLAQRIWQLMEAEGIGLSMGIAARDPRLTLREAIAKADAAMYVSKQTRRQGRSA